MDTDGENGNRSKIPLMMMTTMKTKWLIMVRMEREYIKGA